MSVKRTPGPWEAEERTLDFDTPLPQKLPCIQITSPERDYWIAYVLLDVGKPGEGAANAALLTAAPKMLAVLKQIATPEVAGFIHRRSELPRPIIDAINAAISEAEGVRT